jgi:hypothetical protein
MYVNVEVDLDDILAEMSDDEVQKLFDERFSVTETQTVWRELYDKRRELSPSEFLWYIDTLIQDKTGRIL